MTNTRSPDRAFVGICALVFAASAAVTVIWCSSMSGMPGMEMPGGWTMSMTWMRMPGQSWFAAAATFLGMWTVMMIAMMTPALVPMLARYRQAVRGAGHAPLAQLTTLAGAGYFAAWAMCGVAAFPFGVALAQIAMRVPAVSRAVPVALGLVMVIAGVSQFTSWKIRRLACCRAVPQPRVPANALGAWKHGLRWGLQCIQCCLGYTALLLATGVMDLEAMTFVTAIITAERLAPAGVRVARFTGAIVVAAGLYSMATGWPAT